MSRYSGRLPQSYEQAARMLNGRNSRTLINNTVLKFSVDGESVRVEYHGNTIAQFRSNGEVMLTNAGYGTVSTRERLNAMAPAGVGFVQRNHAQMIAQWNRGEEHLTPGGTVQIAPDGTVSV